MISAIVGGNVLGNHCSPVSDTTIIASMASACDLIDHVNTQLPYAIAGASLALVSYLLIGLLQGEIIISSTDI